MLLYSIVLWRPSRDVVVVVWEILCHVRPPTKRRQTHRWRRRTMGMCFDGDEVSGWENPIVKSQESQPANRSRSVCVVVAWYNIIVDCRFCFSSSYGWCCSAGNKFDQTDNWWRPFVTFLGLWFKGDRNMTWIDCESNVNSREWKERVGNIESRQKPSEVIKWRRLVNYCKLFYIKMYRKLTLKMD